MTGNLEDLPLLDIIQIVSFSKKTGSLSITTQEGEGGIVFRDGFVVSAFVADSAPIDRRFASLPTEQREGVIRSRIEIALEQLIRLREGLFSFALAEEPPRELGGRDISLETLAAGINAQELLIDLARGMDEDRRNSAASVEASFAEPDSVGESEELLEPVEPLERVAADFQQPATDLFGEARPPDDSLAYTVPLPVVRPNQLAAPAAATAPAAVSTAPAEEPRPPARSLLLVDDEDDVRGVLRSWFARDGWEVVEAADPESAVKAGGRLGKAGVAFVLVTDLGMPTSGGASFHGGFEVVKRLWKMKLRPPVLMMTESLSQSLQLRARQMGIRAFVFKPGLSKLNPQQFEADLAAFAGKIVRDILPKLATQAPSVRAPQPAKAAAGPEPALRGEEEEDLQRQFAFLQRRLAELRQPGNANQIAVLVVKVAREFFERGVLFLIKNEEARGLGGFGTAPKGESLNLLARQVVIPLGEPSLLLDVVQGGRSSVSALPSGKWINHLLGRVGRFQANTVALLPLVAHRETIAVLYGDNAETGAELPRLDALEVFVHQAGIALENAFLQKKLQTLQGQT